MTPAERDEILRAHNKYRDEVGVPHLEWDENLATGAQQQYWQQSAQVWADHLASLSSIPVSPHSSSTAIGESIAWGTAGAHTIGQLIDQTWGAEILFEHPRVSPEVQKLPYSGFYFPPRSVRSPTHYPMAATVGAVFTLL